MTIKENDKPHLRQLIKELKSCRAYTEDEHGFEFVIRIEDVKLDNGLISTVKDRRDIMAELEKLEAIKILETKLPEFGIYPFLIRILQPQFNKLYSSFEYEKSEKTAPKSLNLTGCPSFDENKSMIIWNKEECPIPLKTNQYFLCKKMFSIPFGERVKEIDILDLIDWGKDTKRSVYDAMLAVNKNIKNHFDIEKFFKWSNNHVWVDIKFPNI